MLLTVTMIVITISIIIVIISQTPDLTYNFSVGNNYNSISKSEFQQDLEKNKKPFEELIATQPTIAHNKLDEMKSLVDSYDCKKLTMNYNDNPEWTIRPYIAFKILNSNCPLE